MDLLRSQENTLAFVVEGGALHVRRGIHVEALVAGGSDAELARTMLSVALEDPAPDARLVRAFAADLLSRLPREGFELTREDVVAWVEDLGSSQQDDLRDEQRLGRLDELSEYDEEPDDPAERPVTEAGGGVAEGFETAEQELVAHATHAADSGGDPQRDAFPAEAEADPASESYGEANAAGHGGRGDGS